MNKLFTKIASLTLGLALVASAGALIGKGMEAKSVSASEKVAYTLDGTITGGTNGYATESDITQNTIGWKVTGNTTTNPWRIGGNSLSGVDRTAYSTTAMSNTITKVELTVGTASSITVNSLKLLVSTSSTFSSTVEEVSESFAANSTITFPASQDWTNCFFKFTFNVTVTGTSNKFVQFVSAKFYEESTISRGEASIEGLDESVLFVGGSDTLSAGFDPLDSGATEKSHSFSSSDSTVLSVSGDTITAEAPGKAKITLTFVDTNDEEYTVVSDTIYVSNEYSFEVGDNVALYSTGALMELASIDKSNTHYGVGTAYTTKPNGTYLLAVEEGNASGSLSFVNDGNYLAWTSGNSLTTKTTKDDNSSWYVISYDDYDLIINAATTSREIWWNSGSPRFACYEGKTTSSSGYNATSLMKIEEAPVRGTLTIANEFGSTMKQNATDTLTYNWTPAAESSATISSYTWSSSNSEVISISGDVYTAIAPGKAKISLAATDSTGQEYAVSTSDITVVEVVSGSYEKVTSVSDGDVVALVCEADETQLSGVASSIGTYVFYETAPASVYDLTLEADGDYFALKNSEDKYLSWKSEANLELLDEATDKSYWSISFSEGNATISNKALDGETHRYLAWNHNSPRFAAYKTGQTAVQLYAPVTSYSEAVVEFATNFLSQMTCDGGETLPDSSTWLGFETTFNSAALTDTDRTDLQNAKAIDHEIPSTDVERVEAAMARYDLIVAKYNKGQGMTTEYPDFIERNPSALKVINDNGGSINNSTTSIVVVTIISLVSISSIAVLLAIKKRKHN